MKKLILTTFIVFTTLLSNSQNLTVKSAKTGLNNEKYKELESISVNSKENVVVIRKKYSIEIYKIKLKGENYYKAESQTDVISLEFKEGEGTLKYLTFNKEIKFSYK